jgi:putative SOS response-associated peptidase YedK
MPFVLAKDRLDDWIDPRHFSVNPEDEFSDHVTPLEFHQVSPNVNSSRYDAPDCCDKVEIQEQGELF